jgi:archaellum component FlaF (FlaF/FlaG flagellin family)
MARGYMRVLAVLSLAVLAGFSCAERIDIMNDLNSLEIVPAGKDFLNVAVNSSSNTMSFTIKNNGGTVIEVTDVVVTGSDAGDFILSSYAPYHLEPGRNGLFNVTFSPKQAGPKSALIVIVSNAGTDYIVNVGGTGI